MTITGTLEHIDGRKLTIGEDVVVLRKGIEPAQYYQHLMSEVEATYEEEKGYKMVSEVKPSVPKTKAEETKGPIDQAPSANMPKLQFGIPEAAPVEGVSVFGNRTQKDLDIMRQWAIGATLNSKALSECNDALALSTSATIERAKKIAEGLTVWVVTR